MNSNFNISKRTKILAATTAALAVICAAQFLMGLKSPQKTFKFKGTPDYISIENSGNKIVLQKSGDNWICDNQELDANKVEALQKSFVPLKTLGVTSRSANEAALERYGLDKPITVRAKEKDKELISFLIGKDGPSGSQAYIQIEGKKEIYLAKGNLRTLWQIDLESLKPEAKEEAAAEEAPAPEESEKETKI
ncbi:MAG: DUF4340 domain-containing protein [Treponema sp.]|nr:DUF4340 domain-containing protein [Treponema sp.]